MSKSKVEKHNNRLLYRLFHRGSHAESYEALVENGFFFRPSDTLNTSNSKPSESPAVPTEIDNPPTAYAWSSSGEFTPFTEPGCADPAAERVEFAQRLTNGASSNSSPATVFPVLQRYYRRSNLTVDQPEEVPIPYRQSPRPAKSHPMLRDQYNLQQSNARNCSNIELSVAGGTGTTPSKAQKVRQKLPLAQVEIVQSACGGKTLQRSRKVMRDGDRPCVGAHVTKVGAKEGIEDGYHEEAVVGVARCVRGVDGISRGGQAVKRVLMKKSNGTSG